MTPAVFSSSKNKLGGINISQGLDWESPFQSPQFLMMKKAIPLVATNQFSGKWLG